MWLGVLGPLSVRDERAEIAVPACKQRIVLAALARRANQAVSFAELAEAVWDSRPPGDERAALRNYVKRLRTILGPEVGARILTRPPGYLMDIGRGELDLLAFTDLCEAGGAAVAAGDWPRAHQALDQALGLWRGAPLSDVPSELLHREEVPRLDELRLQVVEWHAEARLRLGMHDKLVPELRALAAVHPLRERFHGQLMLALYRSGRQADALAAYQTARRILIGELGVEPGPDLQALHQRILVADPYLADPAPAATAEPGQPVPVPRLPVADEAVPPVDAVALPGASAPRPRQLPLAIGHFVGRARELARLTALLGNAAADSVVITAIGGTAGVGKTSLAVHWAHQVADRFPGGQLYVNLRGFDPSGRPVTPGQAVRGFLDALGVPATRIPHGLDAQVGLYRSLIAGRPVLVVLDNAQDEAQVRPLLPGGPRCFVVVTSRNQLAGLAATEGADLMQVDALAPAEAHELLVRRLGRERADGEQAAAAEIAALCAGLPLALSIAAARAASGARFPLSVLAAGLRDSRDRLDLLDTGDAPSSMRAVLSWSYRNLSGPAAGMFRLLALNPGPDISVPAAASLAGLPVAQARRTLAELAAAHMLTEHAPGRYSFHDLLRAYAADRAGAQEPAEAAGLALRRMLTWYLHSAAAADHTMRPARPKLDLPDLEPGCPPAEFSGYDQALAWLDEERANLVAAVEQARRHAEHEIAWKLAIALWELFSLRGHFTDWLDTHRHALQSAECLDDRAGQAWILNNLGSGYWALGRNAEAIDCYQRALALRRADGDDRGEAITLLNLGMAHLATQEAPAAMASFQRARDIFRDVGYRDGYGGALNGIGEVHRLCGELAEAVTCQRLAIEVFGETGNSYRVAMTLIDLATAHRAAGNHADAADCAAQGLALARDVGNRPGEAQALTLLGHVLADTGRPGDARGRWLEAAAVLEELGSPQAAEVRALLAAALTPAPQG